MRRLVNDPVAYRYEHADGLKCTMLLMNGLVQDFNFAAYVNGAREPLSTQMYLPMPDGRTTLANFFSPLVNHVEKMFLTGKPTYPVERTLLTTGLTAAGVESLYRKQARYRDAAPGHPLPAHQGVDLLENVNHADAPQLSSEPRPWPAAAPQAQARPSASPSSPPFTATLARAAHGRPLPGRLPVRRRVAQARHEGGVAVCRSEAAKAI